MREQFKNKIKMWENKQKIVKYLWKVYVLPWKELHGNNR